MENEIIKARLFGGVMVEMKVNDIRLTQITNDESDPVPQWTEVVTDHSRIEIY